MEGIATCNFPRAPILVTMLPSSLGLVSLQDVIAKGRQNRRPLCDLTAPAAKTLAMLFFSSGTTGPFKGVQLSHTNLIANAKVWPYSFRRAWAGPDPPLHTSKWWSRAPRRSGSRRRCSLSFLSTTHTDCVAQSWVPLSALVRCCRPLGQGADSAFATGHQIGALGEV